MLVAIFCHCNKLMDCVECGGSEDSVAFRGAEAGESKASDATCTPGDRAWVCLCLI